MREGFYSTAHGTLEHLLSIFSSRSPFFSSHIPHLHDYKVGDFYHLLLACLIMRGVFFLPSIFVMSDAWCGNILGAAREELNVSSTQRGSFDFLSPWFPFRFKLHSYLLLTHLLYLHKEYAFHSMFIVNP